MFQNKYLVLTQDEHRIKKSTKGVKKRSTYQYSHRPIADRVILQSPPVQSTRI